MTLFREKAKEVVYSILPITIIVTILHFTIAPVDAPVFGRFLIGAVLVTVGLTVFLVGVVLGISPIGQMMGASLAKWNSIWIVIAGGVMLGFFVSVAEPDLHILADQVEMVTAGVITKPVILVVVSLGIAVMLTFGLLRIVIRIPLYKILTVAYLVIFVLALFSSQEYLAIAFDASGATTGAMTVPFFLALAVGVAAMGKDAKGAEKDSFGLVAIASVGAILSVLVMGIIKGSGGITGALATSQIESNSILWPFIQSFGHIALEIMVALLPIVILFILAQVTIIRSSVKKLIRIILGLLFTFIGLVLFLSGVHNGFMNIGLTMGRLVASFSSKVPLLLIGFALGFVTILAEPAVHVLTSQIEAVTSSYLRKRVILASLAIGIGAAVALTMLRIMIPGIKLWHYLLPGYAMAVALMYFTPKVFIGIAFDAGGVASGPMTVTFILAFAQGAADAMEGASIMAEGFGLIATVAMMPLITLQVLGILYRKLTTS